MSDLVLARKYRPRTFEQMVGQEHVVRALTNALASGRMHHAYLFAGTRGVGKTTVSRILAKSLNCTGPDGTGAVTAQPCGRCQACIEIDADRYIDYIELDAASNRSIDEIRDLIERAAYKPSVGRYKVFMIDEAHQLTKDAFNALLKTLEEPPDYLKFVLATTDPQKMLPTVLSRCLQFNLRPMPPEVVQRHLQTVLTAEAVPYDIGSLRILSRAAQGSMRDALSLADQAIAYGAGSLQESAVRAMLGAVDRGHACAVVEALARRDGRALLERVDLLRELGLSAAGTLEEVAQLLQQMAIEQAVPGALDDNDPETPQARELAALLPADETQLLYSIVLQGRGELALMADEYGAMTMVLLRLLAFPTDHDTPAAAQPPPGSGGRSRSSQPATLRATPLASRADTARGAAGMVTATQPPSRVDEGDADEVPSAPAGQAAQQIALRPAAAPVTLQPTELGERWAGVVAKLGGQGSVAALVRELALQAELVGIDNAQDGERWRLRVQRESLRAPALREKLQAALSQLLDTVIVIEVEAGVAQDCPALREAAERQRQQRQAEQAIEQDPVVRGLMTQFRTARIVPGSIEPIIEPRTAPS